MVPQQLVLLSHSPQPKVLLCEIHVFASRVPTKCPAFLTLPKDVLADEANEWLTETARKQVLCPTESAPTIDIPFTLVLA